MLVPFIVRKRTYMQTATYYEVKDIYVAKVYFGKVLWSGDLFHEYIIYVTFSTNFPLRTSATESPKSAIIPDSAGAEYPAWNENAIIQQKKKRNEMQSQRTISEMEPYMCGPMFTKVCNLTPKNLYLASLQNKLTHWPMKHQGKK